MKNLLFILIGLAFVSCKKNYNCTCSDSSGTLAVTPIKDTRENAQKQCDDYYNQHYGTTFNQVTCTLK